MPSGLRRSLRCTARIVFFVIRTRVTGALRADELLLDAEEAAGGVACGQAALTLRECGRGAEREPAGGEEEAAPERRRVRYCMDAAAEASGATEALLRRLTAYGVS